MTVSPSRPKGGYSQPSAGSSNMHSGPRQTSTPLPPTLFTLPKLRQDEPARTKPGPSATVSQTVRTEVASTSHDAPPSRVSATDTAPATHAVPQTPKALPSTTAPPDTSANPFVSALGATQSIPQTSRVFRSETPVTQEATEPVVESPCPSHHDHQRSVTQRIGSHAIVLVMLLIVVSAALLAGRTTRDETSDVPISESPVVGTAVNPQADFAVSVGQPQDLSITGGDVITNSSSVGSLDAVSGAVASSQAMQQLTANSLPADSVHSSNGDNDFTSVGGMPQTVAGSTVSTRTDPSIPADPSSEAVNVPSNTDSEPFATGRVDINSDNAEPNPGTPRPSRTPNKIMDWSRYFPAPPNNVIPASATTSGP